MSDKKNEIILFENQGVKLEVNVKDELVKEISISIEDYKESLENTDYTKLSAISDNMVYRNKK